jgi:phosphomannomutase
MIYFATGAYPEHGAGIMVTASHNPSQYNGMKLCFGDASPIGAETGMKDIRDIVLAGRLPAAPTHGGASERDITTAYLDKVFSLVDTSAFRPLDVVVDTANGMEGALIDAIFARMPMLRLTTLFKELDGRFPNHEANPLKVETLDALRAKVREIGADVGVAYDGDGDRIGFVDERGEPVPGDLLLALLVPRLLRDAPGAAVVYDVRCSHAVPEVIEAAGGKPIMYKVGHGLIKPFMRANGAVLGGELSMHYYFRDVFNADSTDFVLLLIFEMLSATGKPLSELVAPLRRYHHSGEINSEVADKDGVMAALREAYGALPGATVSDIDGIRVEFRDADGAFLWWFNVRASNTEPVLRLCLEARTKELMEEKRGELLARIRV